MNITCPYCRHEIYKRYLGLYATVRCKCGAIARNAVEGLVWHKPETAYSKEAMEKLRDEW